MSTWLRVVSHPVGGFWTCVYLNLHLKNIASQCIEGRTVGAVMAGDTVVFKNESSSVLVSQTIPYFRSWIHAGKEAAYVRSLDDVLLSEYMLEHTLQLGKEVGETIEHTHVLFDSDILPLACGSIRGYEDVSTAPCSDGSETRRRTVRRSTNSDGHTGICVPNAIVQSDRCFVSKKRQAIVCRVHKA